MVENYFLEPGCIYIPERPVTISTVLGSAVAVCLHDRKQKIGGMCHFLYPRIPPGEKPTARYGNAAVAYLVRLFLEDGSKPRHLEAQIFGGALKPQGSVENIGSANVQVARRILQRRHVRIASEDVGGRKGRKIVYNSAANEIAVLKADNLRREDWYPYGSESDS